MNCVQSQQIKKDTSKHIVVTIKRTKTPVPNIVTPKGMASKEATSFFNFIIAFITSMVFKKKKY